MATKGPVRPVTAVNRKAAGQPGSIERSSWYDPKFGPAGWESAPAEPNIDLQFPYSMAVYDLMARTDPQIGSVLRAIVLSMRRAKWTLNTGADPEPPPEPPKPPPPDVPGQVPSAALPASPTAPVKPTPPAAKFLAGPPFQAPPVKPKPDPAGQQPDAPADGDRTNPKQVVSRHVEDFVRTEIGLPRPGENLPDVRTSTVTFRDHLQELLRCLTFGFSVFEQVYRVEVTDTQETVVHLWKLASRPQKTIEHFLVDPDGELKAVVQQPLPGAISNSLTGIVMPVETVVMYCHEREGADWSGTSILRNCYKNWLIKDVVLRLTAQIVERNGMGIPDVTYDEGGTTSKDEAVELAQKLRAGATAGMAHASDVKVQILGVTGNLVDAVPFLTYNDQQIAGSALAMFQTLGHDNGARALGDTFLDVFTNSLQAEGDMVAETFTQQVIRPLVAANFGPDEPYPVLEAGDMTETGVLDAKSLSDLVAAGLIVPDETLKAFFRTRYDLPVPDPEPEPVPPVIVVAPPVPGAVPGAVKPADGAAAPPKVPVAAPKPAAVGGFSEPIASYAAWLDARRQLLAAEQVA
jgi:hypothetical protein